MKLRIIEVEAAEGEAARIIETVLGGGIPASAPTLPLQVRAPAAPRALAAPAAEPVQYAKPGRRPMKPKNQGRPESKAQPEGESYTARVLEALKLRPMSSLELARHLKVESPKVYTACNTLKTKGLIESRNDDQGDGTRRYFIK